MKKIRLFLGAIALMFAFATSFAFKTASSVEEPAIVNALGNCQKQSVTCAGTNQNCVISGVTYRQFETGTTCGAILKMP